ncbi:type II toxin-antitoxin system VapC family toxin [Rhizobium sp. KVB221]|uniref:Ribonuclease VapC n=1 Tax=Rhizobium setariae TaxID=2801340 RepID=A0A936YVH7_9HYPH|nr:type II toxin-antitoxin system VapC family toxin [Rhizobium setariae]
MIAIDTSVILAIALDEPEAETFKTVLRQEPLLIGWPTLFETRIVLSAKGFANAGAIVARLAEAPNVSAIAFDNKHYRAAEHAYAHYGKGRHPAALNMGNCFSYAVASVGKSPLLFKGNDFAKTDVKCHPQSTQQ